MLTDLLLIAFICTYCIGYSGFMDSMDEWLQRYLKNPLAHVPPPFSCPLCSTYWCSILYLIITHQFTLTGIALACVAAWSTKLIDATLHLIEDFYTRMVDAIYNYFHLYE